MALSNIQTSGRPPRQVRAEITRELTLADLALLGEVRGIKAPSVKRLTDMHHAIARLVAEGQAGYAISMSTGYSQSRISILKADPAFQELVAFYAEQVGEIRDAAYVNTQAKLSALHNDAVEILHERVLEEGHAMPMRDLQDVAKFAADRSGFGPKSKTENTNLNIDIAGQLAVGRQRALELNAAVPAAKAAKQIEAPQRGERLVDE